MLGPVFAPCSKGTLLAPPSRLGHREPGAKRIKACREEAESVLLPLSFLARPLSLCFANRALKTPLEVPGGCGQLSSSIHSQGWATKLSAQTATWALGMNTGCPYSHYLREALVASLSTQPSCCPRAGRMQLRKCPRTIINPLTDGYRIHHLKPH